MRPKKKILVYSPLELGSSPFVFTLNTRGFNATAARNETDFAEALADFHPDAVVLFLYGDDRPVSRLAELAHEREARVMVVPRARRYTWNFVAETVICIGEQGSMERIVDALKTLVLRKRGPKKPSVGVSAEIAQAVSA